MAQSVVTDLNQLNDNNKYTLWTAKRGGWVVSSTFKSSNDAGLGVTNTYVNKAAQFKLEANGDGTYYLYNVGAQKYVKKDKNVVDTKAAADAVTITKNDDGTFFFSFGAGYHMNIGGDKQTVISGWDTVDDGNKIIITDVTECLTVAYVYRLNGKDRGTSTSLGVHGGEYPELVLPYCVTATKPEGTIDMNQAVDGVVTKTIDCTQGELPFQTFADAGSITTWYNLQMHANPNSTKYLKEDGTSIAWANATLTEAEWDKFQWGFVGDAFGVKLIAKNGTAVQSTGTNGDAAQLVDVANGVEYVLTTSQAGAPWFCLKNNTRWLNGQGDVVKQWTENDNGSSIKVSEVVSSYKDYVKDILFAPYKNAPKFNILEGSTVQGPSEFANPVDINTAIDAANAISEDNVEDMNTFIASENGTKIKTYLDQVKKYGALANVQFTMGAEYGTLILPCPSSAVDGLTKYTCAGVSGDNTLNLAESTGAFTQNTPYIVSAPSGSKFTIIGWDKGSRATHKIGLLTGVLTEDGVAVPPESYILAKKDERLGFYQVAEGANYICAQYKCYLTVEDEDTPVKAFYFEGSGIETAIENVMGAQENGAIYDLQGRRVEKAVKGIYIVNGKKVVF